MNGEVERKWVTWICCCLALGTLLVYLRTGTFEFTNYDDDRYVSGNPVVQRGLTSGGIGWGLTTGYMGHWIPVTWWSHMATCDLFGLNPGPHHLVNVVLHILASIGLFLVLNRMTGSMWRCAVVAALFAWHPLHIESVAWIAERKDVLSGLFFVLTLWAYDRYARCKEQQDLQAPQAASSRPEFPADAAGQWYWLTVVLFLLGLMSKPMLVTLPFVLLLLDYWPLRRCSFGGGTSRFRQIGGLVGEKLPFFGLSVAVSWVTYLAQKSSGGLNALGPLPAGEHFGGVLISYIWYLKKAIFPLDLAVPYPYPGPPPLWHTAAALLILGLCSILALRLARSRPWVPVGWLWFIGMLVPVIGIVQVGRHTVADRNMYLPLIGLAIMGVWSIADWAGEKRLHQRLALTACAAVLAACLALSSRQVGFWHDSLSLFGHALKVTKDNAIAHYNYAEALHVRGKKEEAMKHYREALQIDPMYVTAHLNLGILEYEAGRIMEATNHLELAVRLRPGYSLAHYKLGQALSDLGRFQEAEAQFALADAAEPGNPLLHTAWGKASLEMGKLDAAAAHLALALRGDQESAEAHLYWGMVLARQGHLDAAADQVSQALRLQPSSALARAQMGLILSQENKPVEAINEYREALRLKPDTAEVLNNLAWLLATSENPEARHGAEAVRCAERACELTRHQQGFFLGTLAAAYAEAGRFADASRIAQQAIQLAEAAGQKDVAARNRELLRLYENGKPCRESPGKGN